MKKALLLVAATGAVVGALLKLFPDWARRLAGIARPVTQALGSVTGVAGAASDASRNVVSADDLPVPDRVPGPGPD